MKITSRAVWAGLVCGSFSTAVLEASPRDRKNTTGAISALTASDIGATGSVSLNGVLGTIPNRSGSRDQSGVAEVNIRNLHADRTLVLINGRRSYVVGGGLGVSGDPTNNGSASANFADLQFAGGTLFGSGATEGAVAFNLGTRRYDDRVENEDDERSTYDLDVAFTMSRSFSPSFEVNTLINANYGDHGSMGDGYVRSGLQIEPVFDWNTRTSFNYRLDGLEIGSKGWGYSTYYHTHGFVESGSDERDSISIAVGQEVRSTLNNGVTVYLDGQYGMRNFDMWTMYDSDFYSVSAGVRTGGPDWSMDASVGWQQYEYDDLNEKNDNLTAQLYYDRMLTANLGLSIKASYGVQELFPNEGGTLFVNPVGTRLASRLNWAFNDKVDVGLSFSVMDVDSEFSGDYSVHRGAVGLDSTIRINDDWSLDPSIVWVNYENDPTVDEDFVVGRLGVARSF